MEAGATPRGRIGRYEIVRELGRGGMATVYLARQPDLERLVALKQLAAFGSNDPQMVHRFLREAQIAGSVNDPNIVTVYESFVADGMPHIAMEYLRRGSLRPLVSSLALDQVVLILHDMLAGLTAAERRSIVHRDLKPENVLVSDDRHVKITDFGIAKAVDRAATQEFKTATGMTVGTPAYMAPEQAMGREITPATDLYSVGVMAFEMLTGRLPFEADSPVALLMRHVSDEPPSPLTVKPDLDPALSAWILRLLVKDPADRMQTADEAWEELEDIAITLLGPRWRREARLPHVEEPPDEYFTVQSERVGPQPPTTSSAWGLPESGPYTPPPVPGPYTPPPGPLQEPLPTPLPEDMPTRMPTPRSGPGQYTPPPEAPPPATPPGQYASPPGQWAAPPPSTPPGAWTAPPATPPGQYAAPPGTPAGAYAAPATATPPPAPVVEAPRRSHGVRVWLIVLLVLGIGAAAAAFVLRPHETGGQSGGAPTASPEPTTSGTEPTDAGPYKVTLPAGWETKCIERSKCGTMQMASGWRRSAFAKGSGKAATGVSIDRFAFGSGLSVRQFADASEEALKKLPNYLRGAGGKVRSVTVAGGRAGLQYSFTTDLANARFGTVIVFKNGHDAYQVTATSAGDPNAAEDVAYQLAHTFQPTG